MKRKILIDTDPGVDDVMALMLAIKSEQLEIKAITTVAGNTSIKNATRNAGYLLNFLNSNISVYSGARKPLKRNLIKAFVHGKSGLAGIDPSNKAFLTSDASSQIARIVEENNGDLTIVALGPLTNIAKAILDYPEKMIKVKEIIIMGGAFRVSGNMRGISEFNFFVDPEAASIVFDFPVKKSVVPLDACNKVKMSLGEFRGIRNPQIRNLVIKIVGPYIEKMKIDEGIKAAKMYDPLTIYYMLQAEKCNSYQAQIKISLENKTRGKCLEVSDGNEINIVYEISREAFVGYFIENLSKS